MSYSRVFLPLFKIFTAHAKQKGPVQHILVLRHLQSRISRLRAYNLRMPIISVLLVLLVVGVALYFFNTYVQTISPPFKAFINAIVIIAILIWLCEVFGLMTGHMPRFR